MTLRCLEDVVWGYVYPILAWSQTRPTCHNQLAVKADGEMRSPLGEQRWPVFRDGAGRLSSYRAAATRSNHRAAVMITTLTEVRFASEACDERVNNRNARLRHPPQPIIHFREAHSVVFARFQWTGETPRPSLPVCHCDISAHVIRDINGIAGCIIRHRAWRTRPERLNGTVIVNDDII